MILYPEALNQMSKASVNEETKKYSVCERADQKSVVILNICLAKEYFSKHSYNKYTDKHIWLINTSGSYLSLYHQSYEITLLLIFKWFSQVFYLYFKYFLLQVKSFVVFDFCLSHHSLLYVVNLRKYVKWISWLLLHRTSRILMRAPAENNVQFHLHLTWYCEYLPQAS